MRDQSEEDDLDDSDEELATSPSKFDKRFQSSSYQVYIPSASTSFTQIPKEKTRFVTVRQ